MPPDFPKGDRMGIRLETRLHLSRIQALVTAGVLTATAILVTLGELTFKAPD